MIELLIPILLLPLFAFIRKGKYVQLALIVASLLLVYLSRGETIISSFFYFGYSLTGYHFLMSILLFSISFFVYLFSFYYIKKENEKEFYFLISLFITVMFLFSSAISLVQILVTWELMTIISFLLIDFYRDESSEYSALKAISLTYISDIALLIFVVTLLSKGIFTLAQITSIPLYLQIVLLIAVISKSAQFPFTGWLTDAMVAPTPVSALLHSATMVAAGAFLILLLYSHLSIYPYVLLFSILTMTISSIFAAFESNIKKIFAYYTASTLSGILISAFINPFLSFLYLLSHAFYKVSLFIISGKEKVENKSLDLYVLRNKPYSTGEEIALAINSILLADFIPSMGYFLGQYWPVYLLPVEFILTFSAFKIVFTRFHKRKVKSRKVDALSLAISALSFIYLPFVSLSRLSFLDISIKTIAIVLSFVVFKALNTKLYHTFEFFRYFANGMKRIAKAGALIGVLSNSGSLAQFNFDRFNFHFENSLEKYIVYISITLATLLILSIVI